MFGQKKGELMFIPALRKFFLSLSLASLVIACSQTAIQSKRDGPDSIPVPDCQRNHGREGGLFSYPIFFTWVRYDHLEFKKAFDLVVGTLQSRGGTILSVDSFSRTISARMFPEPEQKEGYPATVRIAGENSSAVIHLSVKAPWGTLASPDLCGFYEEYGKRVKRALDEPQTKEPVLSSPVLPEVKEEVPEVKKAASPPASPPPVVTLPPPVPLPPSSPPARIESVPLLPAPRGKVTWVYVNLRDGPGMNYKVIGKTYKDNTFEILNQNQAWLRVRLENGKEGWMSQKAALVTSKPVSSKSPSSPSQDSSRTKTSRKPHEPM
jgi:hypothetical protein